MKFRGSVVLGAALLLALGSPAAHAAGNDLASLMKEATQIAAEKVQIRDQMQQSLSQKRANEQALQGLEQEGVSIAAESNQIEAQRPSVAALCQRKVPPAQFAAAQAECERVLVPFNAHVDAHNTRLTAYKQRRATVIQGEETRAAEAKQLLGRDAALDRRLEQINALKEAWLSCQKRCLGAGTGEGAAYCLQQCWDGAPANPGVVISTGTSSRGTPFFGSGYQPKTVVPAKSAASGNDPQIKEWRKQYNDQKARFDRYEIELGKLEALRSRQPTPELDVKIVKLRLQRDEAQNQMNYLRVLEDERARSLAAPAAAPPAPAKPRTPR
jgi:hypothetical protein